MGVEMKLSDAAQLNAALPLAALASDVDLVRDIQARLLIYGVLDPPVDGKFGSVSHWALREFAKSVGLTFENELTKDIAKALLDADEEEQFSLKPGPNLAGKIISAMQRRGYWICRHRGCFNIVYIEGMDVDGTPNENTPNRFNDL